MPQYSHQGAQEFRVRSNLSDIVSTLSHDMAAGDRLYAFCSSDVDLKGVQEYVDFSQEPYTRVTIVSSDQFELVLICWKPGQKSVLHSHGTSLCAFRCLEGQLTERNYGLLEAKSEFVKCKSETLLQPGCYSASYSSDVVHEIANESARNAISLHVYTPPLQRNTFSH